MQFSRHIHRFVLFVESIGCEMVHLFESLTGGGIYGNFSAMGHMYMAIFVKKLMGIARQGVLKELEVCDFDKIWSVCQ